MRKMWKAWVAQRRIRRKKPRRGSGAGAVQEEVLDSGERDKARLGILLCAPLGLKGPRKKVQSTSGQWYNVHAHMFRRDSRQETGGLVPVMHQGGGAGTVAGPENDGMGVPDRDHAHYGRQGTVVGAGATAAQGAAGGQRDQGGFGGLVGGGTGREEGRSADRMGRGEGAAGRG